MTFFGSFLERVDLDRRLTRHFGVIFHFSSGKIEKISILVGNVGSVWDPHKNFKNEIFGPAAPRIELGAALRPALYA